MPYMFGFFLVVAIVSSVVAVLLTVPAERIARMLRLALPGAMVLIGAILVIIGRATIGLPLAGFGITWLIRNRERPARRGQARRRAQNPRFARRASRWNSITKAGSWMAPC